MRLFHVSLEVTVTCLYILSFIQALLSQAHGLVNLVRPLGNNPPPDLSRTIIFCRHCRNSMSRPPLKNKRII